MNVIINAGIINSIINTTNALISNIIQYNSVQWHIYGKSFHLSTFYYTQYPVIKCLAVKDIRFIG